jgi:hypothetical protein
VGVRIGLEMSEDNVPSWNRTVVPEPSSNIALCDARIVNSTSCHILASHCSESQFCPKIALCGISHVQTLVKHGLVWHKVAQAVSTGKSKDNV